MSEEMKRTYTPFKDFPEKSKQIEYTESTPLLAEDGSVLAKGWARRNVFEYDRTKISKRWRKEWEFYLCVNEKQMCLVSIVSIAIAGYINVAIVDVKEAKFIETSTIYFVGSKCKLTDKGDAPGGFKFTTGNATFEVKNTERSREIHFKKGEYECEFQMDLFENHENITTVIPFADKPKHFFMTTKQNSMPCEGTFKNGDKVYNFSKDTTFCCMDWGRIAAPRFVVWYWGNGSTYITDDEGKKHIFGFEITWGIGDESYATETCLFYDGKAHKIGAVDVEVFPKPDKFLEPWHIISEDGRFDMTMTPICDNHTDTNIKPLLRMHGHQVFGMWNGTAILDDGTKLEIKDMHAFCEYVENKW